MHNLGDTKPLRPIIAILVFFFLIISPTMAMSGNDAWVNVGGYKNFIQYYDSSSVNIDKESHVITVSVKDILTEKGINDFLSKVSDADKVKYHDIKYIIDLYQYNFKEHKYSITKITYYSKSDNILFDKEYPIEWDKIKPDSVGEKCLNKIIKDYKIDEMT
jgi:hypothetical protein